LFEHSCLLLKIGPGRPPAALMLPGDLSDIDALTAGSDIILHNIRGMGVRTGC